MKLTKAHLVLLGEMDAGNVFRAGSERTGVATADGRDVTVQAEALRREAYVTLGKPDSFAAGRRTTRRQYLLLPAGRAALKGAS